MKPRTATSVRSIARWSTRPVIEIKSPRTILSYVALDGIMRSVNDRYTVFLSPKDYAGLNQGLDGGDFGGTGIVIQTDDNTKFISVDNVVPNGPADKAGVAQDDLITAIDGPSTKGWAYRSASGKLRGKEGTRVTLTIQRYGWRAGADHDHPRQDPSAQRLREDASGQDRLRRVDGLRRDTGDELNAALDRLQRDGARALVLDLRDNGGGYLEAAVAVSSKFISSGPIVSVESRASNITTLDAERHGDHTGPARRARQRLHRLGLRDHLRRDSGQRRRHDHGHEDVRQGRRADDLPLPDGSAVKVTTARYLTPRNRDINHLGITPDVVVAENKRRAIRDPGEGRSAHPRGRVLECASRSLKRRERRARKPPHPREPLS